MSNPEKEAVKFTVHYADGSSKTIYRGLLASIPDAETILIQNVGLDAPAFVTLLAGIMETTDSFLRDN